jgi:hypothetical protein
MSDQQQEMNIELVRLLLFKIEANANAGLEDDPDLRSFGNEERRSHMDFLLEAKLIKPWESNSGFAPTWNGYEFLDSIRSEKHWAETKRRILDAGESVSVETIPGAYRAYVKEVFGL